MNKKDDKQLFISAKSLAKRWDVQVPTVHRILARERIGFRLGNKKGVAVRYTIKDIERLESKWQKEGL